MSSLSQSLLSDHQRQQHSSSSASGHSHNFQTVPALPAVRALPIRASVLLFTVCRLGALMAALILWCVTMCIGAIGNKFAYDGGGGGSCFASSVVSQLPETCIQWIAKQPFDGPLLNWTAAFAALTLAATLYNIFSLDPRSLTTDREFLKLMFKGWPPGQAVFLSYQWGYDAAKKETPPLPTQLVRAIGEMLPCAYIDVRCFSSGDPLTTEMTRAVENSAFALVFLTPKYFGSKNCLHELEQIQLLKGPQNCAFFVHESCADEVYAHSKMQHDILAKGYNVFLIPPRYSQSGFRLFLTRLVMKVFHFVLGEEWKFDISPAVVTEMLLACGAAKVLTSGSSGRSPSITEYWESCARCILSAVQDTSSPWSLLGIKQRLPKMIFTTFSFEIISLFLISLAWMTQFGMWMQTFSSFFFMTSGSALFLFCVSMFTCIFLWEYMPFPSNWPLRPIIFQQKLASRHELWLLCILRHFDNIYRPPAIYLDPEFQFYQDEIAFLCECVQSCSRAASPDFSVNSNTPCINVVGISTVLNDFAAYFRMSNDPSMPLKNTIIFLTTPFGDIFQSPLYASLDRADPNFKANFSEFSGKVLIDTSISEGGFFKLPTLLALILRCGLSLPKAGLTPGSLAKSFNLGGDPVSNILVFVATRWLSYLFIFFVFISTIVILNHPCLLRFP